MDHILEVDSWFYSSAEVVESGIEYLLNGLVVTEEKRWQLRLAFEAPFQVLDITEDVVVVTNDVMARIGIGPVAYDKEDAIHMIFNGQWIQAKSYHSN